MVLSELRAFHFLHPAWLFALPVLLLIAFAIARRGRHHPSWSRLIEPSLQNALSFESRGWGGSPVLWLALAWSIAVVALAGPAWRRERSPAYRLPAAWVILMDLSPSMNATDVLPNRATRARYAVEDILSGARDARVALVVFAGDPYTVTPLTTDVATIKTLLEPLAPNLMPETGHRLAPALKTAGRLLRASPGVRGQVIVLTDGPRDPAQAMLTAERLRRRGISVNIVGIGTVAGAPEPNGSGGFVQDAAGRTVMTRLKLNELRRIAAAGGGRYVPLGQLSTLLTALQTEHAHALDERAAAVPRMRVAHFENEGFWLVVPLSIIGALVARRGWL